MFYNALHGIILFGWVFEDSSDLQKLARQLPQLKIEEIFYLDFYFLQDSIELIFLPNSSVFTYNPGHNILKLKHFLAQLRFTTSKSKLNIYIMAQLTNELHYKQPTNLRLRNLGNYWILISILLDFFTLFQIFCWRFSEIKKLRLTLLQGSNFGDFS